MNVSRFSVSFIVFALNEEGNIAATVDTLRQAVEGAPIADYQIVLVNDGSTDKTGAVMDALDASDGRITAVHNLTNLGPGGAFKRGALAARCDYLMPIAGDNAAPADSIRMTIEHLGEADILMAYLANPQVRSWRRRLGAYAFKSVINVLFGYSVPYYNGAIPRRTLFNDIQIKSNGYFFFAEMVVKLMRRGASYVAVGVFHTNQSNASSSALKPANLVKVFKDLFCLVRDVRKSSDAPRLSSRSNRALERE